MYFVVDIEATCWEQSNVRDNNEIIELGVVACDDLGNILDNYQSFVRPVISPKMSKFCRNLIKIQQKCIDEAEPLDTVVSDMQGWMRKRWSGVHPWAAFGSWDEICFRQDCLRHNIGFPFGRFINLKDLYANYSGCDKCGLREALKREGLPWEGRSHRALDDAMNAVKLARFLVIEDMPLGG